MKIKTFRIKNYRSIKDSGDCYLSGDNVTILAGMNESGKSSILEALEDFDVSKPIRKEALPLHGEEVKPEIAITFEIDYFTIHEIVSSFGLEIADYNDSEKLFSPTKKIDLELIKTYPDKYSLSQEDIKTINLLDHASLCLTYDNNGAPEIDDTVNLEPISFIEQLKKYIPNFILFSSFEDIFPSEISFGDARTHELIKDLSIISDLNLDLIANGIPAEKFKHKISINKRINDDYDKYWTQDLTNLNLEWDSGNLYFFIEEEGNFFAPNMRSKGKQWHLAFYTKVSARSKEDVPNILLIDEPGLFLHPKAQKDILKKLEGSATDAPIIFSTHSPYLIETDKLHRIRLVLRRNNEGTTISNKIHKDADKETLTPIITAIGLDLSLGLDVSKDNNIIVEGISDYYYLSAFKELIPFEFNKDVHFIPSAGANKIKFLIPLMIGWGFNYCTVLDHDSAGKIAEKELLKIFGDNNVKTIFVSNNEDEEIEDLFYKEDFVKYVLEEELEDHSSDEKNSKILKKSKKKYDKVLLAKRFYEKAIDGSFELSQVTKTNFENLLKEIDKLLFDEV
jgi:predicted ATP-dependent endonuclease of OLD family